MAQQADLQCPNNSTEACPLDELTLVRLTTLQAQQPVVGLQMGGGCAPPPTLRHIWPWLAPEGPGTNAIAFGCMQCAIPYDRSHLTPLCHPIR